MAQISNPANDRRSLTHTGNEVGDDNINLSQNTIDNNSPVIEWTCPRKYSMIRYSGGTHKTKFVPRTKQTETLTDGGDGWDPGELTISLNNTIQPVAGETELSEQQYPVVVAYNVTQGNEITPTDIDYALSEVTFDSADVSNNDDIAVWPILAEGTLQYRGLDQFGHEIAPLDEWSMPLHVFHDFNQQKNETEIHMVGSAEWREAETLGLYIDSPHQIVWDDADFPRGEYASQIEQRVDVTV